MCVNVLVARIRDPKLCRVRIGTLFDTHKLQWIDVLLAQCDSLLISLRLVVVRHTLVGSPIRR